MEWVEWVEWVEWEDLVEWEEWVDLVEWVGLEQAQRTNRNATPWDLTIQAITALMTETMKVLMAEEATVVL